jgi:hypothetical protein
VTRTQKIWTGIGIGFIVLATAGFLARDWLGPRVARTYITIFYKNSVNVAFRESFDPLDAVLRKHGVVFRGTPAAETVCEVKGYDTLLMTNSCDIIQQSNSVPLSNEFITEWQRTSPELEKNILGQGWSKSWNQKQDITQLFSDKTSGKAMSVNYEKRLGETKCLLSIAYTASYDPAVFFANRECHRAITLFGE